MKNVTGKVSQCWWGIISIEKSELLSSMLKRKGIPHEVLNAKYHEKEAEIVAQAGQRGAVTIATNMAGRGTDIVLGDGVPEIGGLHIIVLKGTKLAGLTISFEAVPDVRETRVLPDFIFLWKMILCDFLEQTILKALWTDWVWKKISQLSIH